MVLKIKIYLKKKKRRTSQDIVIRFKNHASKANGESEEAKDVPSVLKKRLSFFTEKGTRNF